MINPYESRVATFDTWFLSDELYRMQQLRTDLESKGITHSVRGCHPDLTRYMDALNKELIQRGEVIYDKA